MYFFETFIISIVATHPSKRFNLWKWKRDFILTLFDTCCNAEKSTKTPQCSISWGGIKKTCQMHDSTLWLYCFKSAQKVTQKEMQNDYCFRDPSSSRRSTCVKLRKFPDFVWDRVSCQHFISPLILLWVIFVDILQVLDHVRSPILVPGTVVQCFYFPPKSKNYPLTFLSGEILRKNHDYKYILHDLSSFLVRRRRKGVVFHSNNCFFNISEIFSFQTDL